MSESASDSDFDALVRCLARGDQLDQELVDDILEASGHTADELRAAVIAGATRLDFPATSVKLELP